MKRKTYDVLGKRLHGIRLVTIRARQPRIFVEYKTHDQPRWTLEECKTMGVALSVAHNLIENFAQARIVWERP